MGADAVGLRSSPRPAARSRSDEARDIVAACPPEVLTVGVFRDEAPAAGGRDRQPAGLRGRAAARRTRPPSDQRQVRERVRVLIQGLRRRRPPARRDRPTTAPTSCMLDSPTPGRAASSTGRSPRATSPGATGHPRRRPHPDNVAEAIARCGPGASTSPSGVEAAPGARTPSACDAFVAAAKGGRPRLDAPCAPEPASPTPGPPDGPARPNPPASVMGDPARRPLRPVRRPVRARDARPRLPGARGGVPRRLGRRRLPRRARRPAARLRRPAVARSPSASGSSDELGLRLLLKREDLNHTGSHKINNVLGQALLAQRMGKQRARRRDRRRPARRRHRHRRRPARHGVRRLHGRGRHGAPGAQRVPHAPARRRGAARPRRGSRTLKDAVNEAMRDWVATVESTPLLPRLGDGPAPVPVDGARVPPGASATRPASSAARWTGAIPDVVVACVGGGSNAIGIFSGFADCPTPSWWASSRPAAPRSAGACPASCTARRRS